MQTTKNFTLGIICAMKIEAEGIIALLSNEQTQTVSGIIYHTGNINGKNIVVAVSGVGKVFAAVCTQTMILKFNPDLIIASGIAGSLSADLTIGNIAVADSLVQHDMDTSAVGDPVGLISGINIIYLPCDTQYSSLLVEAAGSVADTACKRGVIASGDQFICKESDKQRISSQFGAIACEMEGASVAQVCYVSSVPVCVMRAISDGGDEAASVDYPAFSKMAAQRAVTVIEKFIALI